MRVFIVSDMEGVAGISNWQQVAGGESLYEEGRKLYTQEINAAVRGARSGGATEVVVMDCHGAGKGWSFNSLIPEDLDEGCEFWVVGGRPECLLQHTIVMGAGKFEQVFSLGRQLGVDPPAVVLA